MLPHRFFAFSLTIFLAFSVSLPAQTEKLAEHKDDAQPKAGLLSLMAKGNVVLLELHRPLSLLLPNEHQEILSSSDPNLSTENLNQIVLRDLHFSWTEDLALPKPKFNISESIGEGHYLLSAVTVSWKWQRPMTTEKKLLIDWKGASPLGLWIDWPNYKQKDFSLEPNTTFELTPTPPPSLSQIFIQERHLSPLFIPAFVTTLAVSIFFYIRNRSPIVLFLPIASAVFLWTTGHSKTLNSDLLEPWLESKLEHSLLGNQNDSPSSLYQRLSKTFHGKALEKIYLEYRDLDRVSGYSSQKQVNSLSIQKIKVIESKDDRHQIQVEWTLSGIVQHSSHLHIRKTKHLDHLTLQHVDEFFKVTHFHPIQQLSQREGN